MHTITQSVFLQSLGYAIANSLWQAALLWLLVMAINNIFKFSSAAKYYTAVAAQVIVFTWFISTFQYYYSKLSEALLQAGLAEAGNSNSFIAEPALNSFSSSLLYVFIKTELLLPYLSVAYLMVLLILVARFVRAYQYTGRLKTSGLQKADLDVRLFVKQYAAILSVKREIKVYFSEMVKSPLTIGFLKPVILLPLAGINNLTAEQMEAVLLHELAHIKRADYLLNILMGIAETLLFFNPFTILIGKIIKAERENSCDDYVLQFQYSPAVYAQALLQVAYIQTRPSFTMQAAKNNKGELLQRVKRMLQKEERNYQFRNRVGAMVLLTFLLTSFAWMQPPVQKKKTEKNTEGASKLFVQPFSATIDNPLFNPAYFFTKPLSEDASGDDNATASANNSEHAEMAKPVSPAMADMLEQELNDAAVDIENSFRDATEALNNLEIESPADSAVWNKTLQQTAVNALKNVNIDEVKKSLSNLSIQMKDIFDGDGLKANFEKLISGLQEKKQTAQQEAKALNEKWKEQYDAAQKQSEEKILKQQKALQQLQQATEKLSKQKITASPLTDDNLTNALKNYIIEHYLSAEDSLQNTTFVLPAALNEYSYSGNTPPDSESAPGAGFIVIQHHPENDSSYRKLITVLVIGADGTERTFNFSVEVYQ